MPKSIPEDSPLRIFFTHGCFVSGNGEAIGDCPFCDKEQKFYVNSESGLFNCMVCGLTGNPLEFLRLLHKSSSESTQQSQYEELAKERKYISIDEIVKYEFAFNNLRDEWIVPGFYQSGENHDKLKQLYRWTDYNSKDGKKHLWATKGFGHCLYGIREFDPGKPDVYICEGPWDAMALIETLRFSRITDTMEFEFTGNEDSALLKGINVLAIPSLNTLNEDWLSLLSGKRVYLFLDNDHPKIIDNGKSNKSIRESSSWSGYKRIIEKIKEYNIQPESIHFMNWGKGCKEITHSPKLESGYDIRDLLGENYTKPLYECGSIDERIDAVNNRIANLKAMYEYVDPVPDKWYDSNSKSNTSTNKKSKGKEETLGLLACNNWIDLTKQWEEVIIFHDGVDKTLSAMIACIASVLIPGTQVWLRVISEPSSGKSILCDAICVNQKYVSMQSNIRGFFSGMRPSKKQSKEGIEDLGLLGDINMKAFVTKDADPILQSADRPRIMAEARDLFDGKTATHFRTGMGRKYPIIRTVWIMCGTNRVRDIDENDLGGRFLDCTIIRGITEKLRSDITRSAIDSMFNLMDKRVTTKIESLDSPEMLKAKQMTGGYIEHICSNGEKLMREVQLNTRTSGYKKFVDTIECLSQFVAKMRTRPGKKDEFITEELPARLGEQFTRFAVSLAVVLNKKHIDTQVLRRTAEIAFDTAQGSVFLMTKYLFDNSSGATQDTLWKVVKRQDREYKELLRFLVRLKAFRFSDESKYSMDGWTEARYTLSQELRTICNNVFPYMEHIL